MPRSYDLPTVRVGNINITWNNGNAHKPANSIDLLTLAKFELLEDYKINWVSEISGLITLRGNYNYLVFNEIDFYYLQRTSIVDVQKQIFVYTLTKDFWMTYINKSDGHIKGYLIKTSDEKTLWQHIQKTRAASTDVNSQRILPCCIGGESTKCGNTNLFSGVNITKFKRNDKGDIIAFGDRYRFKLNDFKAFKEKLAVLDYSSLKEANQVFSYCKMQTERDWRNDIAKLLEDYLTHDVDQLTLASPKTSENTTSAIKTLYLQSFDGAVLHYITKVKKSGAASLTILDGTEVKDKVLRDFDLTQIDNIEYVDLLTLKETEVHNRSIFDMTPGPKNTGVTKNNNIWHLKAKMYGHNISFSTFRNLPMSNTIKNKNYVLNDNLLASNNLKSIKTHYTSGKQIINNNFPPTYYYPSWLDTLNDKNLKNIINAMPDISTEIGYLLNNISGYENTIYKNLTNRHVYNGEPIFITTGVKFHNSFMNCSKVKKSDNTVLPGTSKLVDVSEVFRTEIKDSFWLTLLNIYLWWGELDQSFYGLSPGFIDSEFFLTKPVCTIDADGKVITYTETEAQTNLPTWEKEKIDPSDGGQVNTFKKALQIYTKRRKNIEIKEQIGLPIVVGDIYWSDLAYGLFPKRNSEYIDKEELKITGPTLIVYRDSAYQFGENPKTKSLEEGDFGFKFGLLNCHKPELKSSDKDNLIVNNEESPNICYIKPLLSTKADESTYVYDYDKFERDIMDFLKEDDRPNRGINKDKIVTPDLPARWNVTNNKVWIYPYFDEANTSKGWSWFYVAGFNFRDHWPKLTNGKFAMISHASITGNKYGVRIHLFDETGKPNKFMQLGCASYEPETKWRDYINTWYLNERFVTDRSQITSKVTSWTNLNALQIGIKPDAQTAADPTFVKNGMAMGYPTGTTDKKGVLAKIIISAYKEANKDLDKINEKTLKYTYIDEKFLKTKQGGLDKTHCFAFKNGLKTSFYMLVKWAAASPKPIIEIVINDPSLIDNQPTTNITIKPSSLLTNNNLVQVVNQQNFLYIYGRLFPIKTKIVTDTGQTDFIFKVDSLILDDDKISTHYRLFFQSGTELIIDNISIVKREIAKTLGEKDQFALARLQIEMNEQRERRRFELGDLQEQEKLKILNLRNQSEDLAWEQSWGVAANWTGNIIGVAGGLASAVANPLAGSLTLASAVTGGINSLIGQQHQLNIKQRNLSQQQAAAAFEIENSKNKIDSSHKFAALRENARLSEITNVHYASAPNNANIIQAASKFDTDGADIAILNRVPTGEVLEYLTDYHDHYGYDIALNKFQLNMRELNNIKKPTVYQFSRIDDVSTDDPLEYEAIRNIFMNSVYLVNYTYKTNPTDFNVISKKYEERRAQLEAIQREEDRERAAQKLAELEAQAKGAKQAEAEYKELLKKAADFEKEKTKLNKELELLKIQVDDSRNKLSIYSESIEAGVNAQIEELKKEWDLACKEQIKNLEEEHAKKLSDCEDLVAEDVKNLNQLQLQLTALRKDVETGEKLRNTYNQLVDEHKKKLDEIKAKDAKIIGLESDKRSLEDIKKTLESKEVAEEEKVKECLAKIKSPEEQAAEYHQERIDKIDSVVQKMYQSLHIVNPYWTKIFGLVNDSDTYLQFWGTMSYQWGNNLNFREYGTSIDFDVISGTWGNNQRVLRLNVEGFDVDDSMNFKIYDHLYEAPTIYVNAFEKDYFGFKLISGDKNGVFAKFGIYSESHPTLIAYYLTRIICVYEEMKELAEEINTFFTTDNIIMADQYPNLENDAKLKKLFREFDFKIITTTTEN